MATECTMSIHTSMARSLDSFCNVKPLTTMKICQIAKIDVIFCQMQHKPSKNCQRLLQFAKVANVFKFVHTDLHTHTPTHPHTHTHTHTGNACILGYSHSSLN